LYQNPQRTFKSVHFFTSLPFESYNPSLSSHISLSVKTSHATSKVHQRSKRKTDNEKENMNDQRKTWKNINNLLTNRNSLAVESCQKLNVNGLFVTDKSLIATEFNTFFVNVSSKIKESIAPNPPFDDIYQKLGELQINSGCEVSETSETEFLAIIANLKSSDAKDVYGMSDNILKTNKM
jgi:hypothetical protein